MTQPLLSAVVLNWNARSYIVDCLNSILNTSYNNLEIILVDNHSQDDSITLLKESLTKEQLSKIRIIVNEKNYGAAQALNQGASLARGKYTIFIATDTKVDAACFSEMVRILESDESIGAASCKLLMMDNPIQLDSAGEYLNQYGFLLQRHAGQEIDRGQFSQIAEIFSVKGTALTVRKDVFDLAGGYPEDYFMFLEETDLCWRIWLSGSRVVFVPSALIYHVSGASINSHKRVSYLVKYYGSRNYITTLFKNLGGWSLAKVLPIHIFMWLALSLLFILKKRRDESIYIAKGVFWNFLHFPKLLKQRLDVQVSRKVSDSYLIPKIMRRVKLSYLFDRAGMW